MKVHHFNDIGNGSGSGEPSEMISLVDQNNTPDLFFININYHHVTMPRADNAGIMLLKHLRLCRYRQHCVIYSFLSREQLMLMDWRNLIIFSEGVTFVRMPCDLEALDYTELSKKKAPKNLSAFFKAQFQLPDNRHFFANWWGILRLWQVHKLLLNAKDTEALETSILEHAQKEMMTYQGLMAQYIYGINQEEIKKSLTAISMRMRQDRLNDLKNERTLAADKLRDVENALKQNPDTTKASKGAVSGNWMAALKMVFQAFTGYRKQERPVQNTRQMLEKKKKGHKVWLQQIDNEISILNSEINEQPNTQPDDQRSTVPNELLQVLKRLRTKVAENTPNILYIDDQANEGWQQIFGHILFGEKTDKFSVYQPANENSEAIINRSVRQVRENKPDLILLDLRLYPEDEHIKSVSEISGVKVLKTLKKEFANTLCPVLVVSASNKLWSYKNVLGSGADAYWIKEGLDNRLDAYASAENYERLLTILEALLFSEEYGQLKEIKKIYEQIMVGASTYWWESVEWIHKKSVYDNVDPIRKDAVLATLAEAIKIMEDKLAKELFIEMQPGLNSDYRPSVAGKLFKIIEDIHKTRIEDKDDYKQKTSLSQKISNQLYGYSRQLPVTLDSQIKTRNKAIHKQHLEANEFMSFVNNLTRYLTEHPNPSPATRPAGAVDESENTFVLTGCVSQVTRVLIKRKEILLTRPDKMPDYINCSVIISLSRYDIKQNTLIKEGTWVTYNLTLQKTAGRWVGLPSAVKLLYDTAE